METKPLRTIHVGVAKRGAHHLRTMCQMPQFKVVAGVDINPKYVEEAVTEFGIPSNACFPSLGEALRHVEADAVVIVSSATFHGKQIEEALAAGKHIMVEKPFTIDLAQAERLVSMAEARGLKIMVTQQARYFPAHYTLQRFLREKTYGEIGCAQLVFHKFRPTPYRPSPHQQLWQMSVHELDTLRAIIPAAPRTVYALECRPPWTAYETAPAASAIIGFEGGITGTYLGSSDSKTTSYELRVECAEGALIQRGCRDGLVYRGALVLAREKQEEPIALAQHPSGLDPEDGLMPHLFYQYVTEGTEPDISGRNNLGTMRLVDACVRSAETGQVVSL